MKKAAEYIHNISNKQIFTIGLLAVIASFVPYIILGMDSMIPYHDQLDVEFINYMYRAKYLISGSDTIPEFLNGASKTAMTPPAPLAVLFFRVLSPLVAYLVLQFICQIISYVGMYNLARVFTDKGIIALIVAFFFTYNPFLPVHGLAVYGTPMLVLCILSLHRGRYTRWSYVYIIFYASMSSLVLCGFAWLGIWLLGLIALVVTKQLKQHKELIIGFLLMISVYVAENLSLLGQMFGITASVVSHKNELGLNGGLFWDTFINYLLYNDQHTQDNHIWILCLTCLVCLLLWCFASFILKRNRHIDTKCFVFQRNLITVILIFNLAVYLVAALWSCSVGVAIRVHLGTLGAFQANRIIWLTPVLWYIELTLCFHVLWSLKGWWKWLGYGVTLPLLLYTSFVTVNNSMLKPCLQEILLEDYETISFSDYYAIGVMEQVEAYIEEAEGLQKPEYKVASLGIDPAAALYHGFYCVDGYSNNYDLEYKHSFRKVIEPELERNEWLKNYYDTWGNRCYLFFSEIPGYYNIERNSFWFKDLQLNTAALKELGCDYILSAAYIVNAEENALELIREEPFNTDSSYYQIFIYKIKR